MPPRRQGEITKAGLESLAPQASSDSSDRIAPLGELRVRKDLDLPQLIWALGGPTKLWTSRARGLRRGPTALEFGRGWIQVPRWFPLGPHLETSLEYYQIYASYKYGRVFREQDVERLHELPEAPEDEHGALVVGGSANHWHLLLDCLPRLALPALRPELRRRTLLVPSDLPLESQGVLEFYLERHGWGAPVRRLPAGYHRIRSTIVPGRIRPTAAATIHRTILDVPADSNDFGPELLFVRRDNARRRLLVNQDELQSALEPLGFAALDPGNLPFRRQVAWFRRARLVVAVHGAAMANLLFAPAGCRVLELHGGVAQRFYRELARVCGHEHVLHHVPNLEGTDDFRVDPERIVDQLRKWV